MNISRTIYSDEIEMENDSDIVPENSIEESIKINGILKNNTNYLGDQRTKYSFYANQTESSRTYNKKQDCQTKFQNSKIIEKNNNLNNNVINNINGSGISNLDKNSEKKNLILFFLLN